MYLSPMSFSSFFVSFSFFFSLVHYMLHCLFHICSCQFGTTSWLISMVSPLSHLWWYSTCRETASLALQVEILHYYWATIQSSGAWTWLIIILLVIVSCTGMSLYLFQLFSNFIQLVHVHVLFTPVQLCILKKICENVLFIGLTSIYTECTCMYMYIHV